jgi:hypothetical protein
MKVMIFYKIALCVKSAGTGATLHLPGLKIKISGIKGGKSSLISFNVLSAELICKTRLVPAIINTAEY